MRDNTCHYFNKIILLLCVACIFCVKAIAQQTDSVTNTQQADSVKKAFTEKAKATGAGNAIKSIQEYREGRIAIQQDIIIAAVKKEIQKAKDFLKRGIDTVGINAELNRADKWYDIAGDGVFTNAGTVQSHRNLTTTSKLILSLLESTQLRKNELDVYHNKLTEFRNQIDSLSSDSSLNHFPTDSVSIVQYAQKLLVTAKEIVPIDSAIKKASADVHVLQIRATMMVNKMQSALDEIDHYDEQLSRNAFSREVPNIWGPVNYKRPLTEILYFSQLKATKELSLYFIDNIGRVILLVIFIILLNRFLKTLKRKLVSENSLKADFAGQLVFRYPVYSSVLIIINLCQFIFLSPPFIFSALLWVISSVCLTIIFKGFITGYWMRVWASMFIFFVFACFNNTVLQASRDERLVMLLLSVAGIICGCYVLLHGHKNELKEKAILYFIAIVALAELMAAVTNIFGRYNLSKNLLTSGYINIIIGILFLWTVRFINEVLAVTSEVYKTPQRKSLYINFSRVGNKVPFIFYVLLIVGWFILFGRNFYSFRLISEPVKNFLFDERTVGNFTFTLSGLLTFFAIMFTAAVISRIVSFFASDDYNQQNVSKEKRGIGSWLLLIRICIISIGLFLAIAATGVPMDKLTIIIGALSVGIGLGLQSLVNNLVSGLIIAFEKPVNTGDFIEVAGHSGIMKSIGFRSSIIATWEGSDVVIPNGDLLSAHLVNWTVRDNSRRVELIVGVAYGTDLALTKDILTKIVTEDTGILKYPAPAVFFKDFSDSSILVRLTFWVSHYSEFIAAKSKMINEVSIAFKENNIKIPFPQQDIHIRSYPIEQKDDFYKSSTEK